MKNEANYLMCMRECIRDGIKIYPVNISGSYYIEINDNGYLHLFEEQYKSKARWKKDKHWHIEVLKLYQLLITLKNNPKMSNILIEANEIINERDNEKANDYGPFHNSMRDAAKIMTILTGKHITTRDFYKAMMSLKLARLQHSSKYDTQLDLIAYIASMSTLSDEPLTEKDFGS